MIRKVIMEKLNFEQTKSVTYWAVGSKFVIPWDIKDPSRIHAEVGYSDGRVQELAISQDFDVDGLNAWLTVNNREGDFIRIFEGEKQTFKEYNSDSPRAPHNEVQKKVNQVAVLTQKMNIIDGIVNDLATQTKDVGRKLEQIDLSKLEQIDLSEMAVLTQKMNIVDGKVNNLATQTEVVGRKLEQIDLSEMAVLTQKMNIVDGIVNDLATQTKDVGRKLEQIASSKAEGLDPQTRKYLQDIQTQLTSNKLTLQHDDTRGYDSSIRFKDKDGVLDGSIKRVVKGDITGLSIATKNKSGSLENRINFYDDMDVYINGQCFVKGTDTSIFDEIKRQLKPYILGLLQDRTTTRCARIRVKASIGDIISGSDIEYWAYPSENSSGYIYISASVTQEHKMAVSAENARKRWRIMGKTDSYYITLYWLQEVINFDD
ncbi:hypothetical protein IDJ79_05345 [Candidatus Liberibacter asiaticus]|uniref:hypothetical protein n=1 Tax=Liberibacter asiaticus TaxID=34021 RepID=UPI001EE638EA|nr:hypothetical protein [Candidatus Liberibacter asiaticus]UKY34137.1 hypothetical protein IDJ79_05345 [Candidatus Liberibacter asiaticus]